MSFEKLKTAIMAFFLKSGYSRAAHQLLQLDNQHLKELGISRTLLKQGHGAYPWRERIANSSVITSNVETMKPVKYVKPSQVEAQTPIAA